MQPKPGALQAAVRATNVEDVKVIARACSNRRQLDDVDGDGRTALMVATVGGDHLGSPKVDHDVARQMTQVIWNRYRQLGCDLRDMLLYEHQGVYEQWNLLQQAAKYSCADNLELILNFYEWAFPKQEGLGFLANPKYLDMNHVAGWAEPIISERIFSKSCDGTHATRSSCGAAATGARDKGAPSQKTPGQNCSDSGDEGTSTDTDDSSGAKGNDSSREYTPSKKKRAPDSSASGKAGETGRKKKKRRTEVEDSNNNQEEEEEKKEDDPHSNKGKNQSNAHARGGNNDAVPPSHQPSPVFSRNTPTNPAGCHNTDSNEEEEMFETFPSSEQLGSCVKTLGRLLEISLNRSGAGGGTQKDFLKTILHLTKHMTDSSHRVSLNTLLCALRDSIRREVGNHEDQLVLVQAMLAVVGPN